MSRRLTVGPSSLLGLALGGVLAGHALTYRLLVPDAHARTAELAGTGHGYLAGADALGLIAVIAVLSILFLGRLVRAGDHEPRVVWRLTAFQLTAFTAMELLERLGSGAGFHRLTPVLVVGLPAQLLVAAIVAQVVRLTLRAAAIGSERTAGGSAAWPVATVASILRPIVIPRLAPVSGAPPGRAPPFVR